MPWNKSFCGTKNGHILIIVIIIVISILDKLCRIGFIYSVHRYLILSLSNLLWN